MDRLSELPDPLILLILSFLSMRDVVSTTFLSRRWNNLWTNVPSLNFCEQLLREGKEVERARSFVNRALTSWVGTKVLKFKIVFGCDHPLPLARDIDSWVHFSVDNEVEYLKLHLGDYYSTLGLQKDSYRAPQCLNSCSSIRELSLAGCNLHIPVSPPWNQLKCLKINGFRFSERLINRIMLGSPRLEVFELRLQESNRNLNVRSTSLKKLKIEKYLGLDNDEPSANSILKIHCSNLDELELSGASYSNYNFSNISSLTAATFRLRRHLNDGVHADKGVGEMLSNFLSTIQRVERLALSDWSIQVLGYTPVAELPDVKFLELDVFESDLQDVTLLFDFFPNLMTLVIRDRSQEDILEFGTYEDLFETMEMNLSEASLVQLKTIELDSYFEDGSVFKLVEVLLKHATALEKFVIRLAGILHGAERLLEIAETLLSMPRSSPTAKVIFKYRV